MQRFAVITAGFGVVGAMLASCSAAPEGAPPATPLGAIGEALVSAPDGVGSSSTPIETMRDAVPRVEEAPAEAPPPVEAQEDDSDGPSADSRGAVEEDAGPRTPRVPPEAFSRATVPIVDDDGGMRHFYERLAAVARGEPGTLARLSVYSDSINGTEAITSAIRHAMQERFGDGGKGWIPIGPGWPTQLHRDVVWHHHRGWLAEVVNRGNGPGDRYGLGGVMSYNRTRHSRSTFATLSEGEVGRAVSRFRLFYQAWSRGGRVALSVDGEEPTVIDTGSERMEDRVVDLTVPDGPHSFEVSVDEGALRLYGVVMERDGPGVVVDGLMLIGARARRLALFDAAHLGRQVAQRETDLLVFWLGGNDAESSYFNHEGFIEDYGAGIAAARAGRPEASCLVVSVLDVGQSPGGRTRRRVPGIVAAQRQVALDHGCAFLDFFTLMGGAGTARRWYRSRPRLLSADYIHPTLAGAQEVGALFVQSLLRGYDEHLAVVESPDAVDESPAADE